MKKVKESGCDYNAAVGMNGMSQKEFRKKLNALVAEKKKAATTSGYFSKETEKVSDKIWKLMTDFSQRY